MFGCFRLAPYHVIADRVRRGAPHHCLDDSLREYGPALSEPPYVPVDLGLSGMSWPAFADMFRTAPQTGRLSQLFDEPRACRNGTDGFCFGMRMKIWTSCSAEAGCYMLAAVVTRTTLIAFWQSTVVLPSHVLPALQNALSAVSLSEDM